MEYVILLGIAFVIAAALVWRFRRGGTGDDPPTPHAPTDVPNHEDAEWEAAKGRAPAGRR
jgi:hypothetical protein